MVEVAVLLSDDELSVLGRLLAERASRLHYYQGEALALNSLRAKLWAYRQKLRNSEKIEVRLW